MPHSIALLRHKYSFLSPPLPPSLPPSLLPCTCSRPYPCVADKYPRRVITLHGVACKLEGALPTRCNHLPSARSLCRCNSPIFAPIWPRVTVAVQPFQASFCLFDSKLESVQIQDHHFETWAIHRNDEFREYFQRFPSQITRV